MRRLLAPVLLVALLTAGCGDDGPPSDGQAVNITTSPPPTTSEDCIRLGERYLRRARPLFDREGTPPDAVVDRTRARLEELDAIATAAGCGPEYATTICDGFDDMTREGVLVVLPLTTAQCN